MSDNTATLTELSDEVPHDVPTEEIIAQASSMGFNSFPYDGDLITGPEELVTCLRDRIGTRKQAEKFFRNFVMQNSVDRAILHIGYLCGELPIPECDRLLRLFGINHPFAGGASASPRTINNLIARGMSLGEEKALETYRNEQMIKLLDIAPKKKKSA